MYIIYPTYPRQNTYYRPQRSLGQGNILAPVCHSVHRGDKYLGRYPLGRYTPWKVHPLVGTPPGRYTPLDRHTPQAGTPPWAGTPPRQVHPPGQVHPTGQVHPPWAGTPSLGRYTPWESTSPEQYMLGDTGNKWVVCILLECILVKF